MSLETLFPQLAAVRTVVQQQYWLSTEELGQLLGIDPKSLDPRSNPITVTQFAWRNFTCTRLEQQGSSYYWKITAPLQPDPVSVPMPAALEPPTLFASLSVEQPAAPAPVEACQWVQFDQFLLQSEAEELLQFTVDSEEKFVPTTTSTGAADYRSSFVLFSFPRFSKLITDRIRAVLPVVLQKLEIPVFTDSGIEAQLTVHGDGGFYKLHDDLIDHRFLTFVYYFNRQAKAFSGGELRIYDTTVVGAHAAAADSFTTIEPRHNSIVFFPSRHFHEVLPIQVPSGTFADSRFTINGWISRLPQT